ncbi:hypothetical protein DOY81_010157, partial [Sarcophaga bullata]
MRDILEFEGIQFEEEILLLLNERLQEQFQKRLDWINAWSLERAKAEEELLKLKNQQRELEENDSPKRKRIEKKWLKVMERLNKEREYQDIYEQKLRKVIEGTTQSKNQEIDHSNKMQRHFEMEQCRKEEREDNQRLLFLDEKYRQEAKLEKILNRTRQDELLKCQIDANNLRKCMEIKESLVDGILRKNLEDEHILLELAEAKRQNTRNRVWHKAYLENCLKEKEEKVKEQQEYDRMYLNTGCVLQQQTKKPYGK